MDMEITIESGAPCGDGDVGSSLGSRCIPLTTETISSQIHNADPDPGPGVDFPVPPASDTGNAIDCLDLAAGITTDLTLVGTLNFFESAYDINTIWTVAFE
jgi:hypothetical protein